MKPTNSMDMITVNSQVINEEIGDEMATGFLLTLLTMISLKFIYQRSITTNK